LDLNRADDRKHVKAQWRHAIDYIPGEPNPKISSRKHQPVLRAFQTMTTPSGRCARTSARICPVALLAWYRTTVGVPESLEGIAVANSRMYFETNVDNYGEIWIDGHVDGVWGLLRKQRPAAGRNHNRRRVWHEIRCRRARRQRSDGRIPPTTRLSSDGTGIEYCRSKRWRALVFPPQSCCSFSTIGNGSPDWGCSGWPRADDADQIGLGQRRSEIR